MQYVRQLVLDHRTLVRDDLLKLLVGLPLHQRQQLRRLHAQGDRQFLGRVELRPTGVVAVPQDALGQPLDRVVGHRWLLYAA